MMNNNGVIAFRTGSQRALWEHEIRGQLSDGMWESARPFEHWRAWVHLTPVISNDSKPFVKFSGRWPSKVKYALLRLMAIPEICDRMVVIGRMGQARITSLTSCNVRALEVHLENRGDESTLDFLTSEERQRFLETKKTYTKKELRKDLMEIQALMKSAG